MARTKTKVKENLYLHSAELSGYKTIKNTSVEFKSGLNIIIGINGVGKTNFLTYLHKALTFELPNSKEAHTHVTLKNGDKIEIFCKSNINDKMVDFNANKERILSQRIDTKLFINKKKETIPLLHGRRNSPDEHLDRKGIRFQSTFLEHMLPLKKFYFVDKPYTFNITEDDTDIDIFSLLNTSHFIRSLLTSIDWGFDDIHETDLDDKKLIKSKLYSALEILNYLRDPLQDYTPIQNIRFNENINISVDNENKKTTVSNIFLEFKIGGSWYPFNDLSDGTKRMFYIISEIAFPTIYYYTKNGVSASIDTNTNTHTKIPRIILLEEPELGLHPHQLFKLMQFLKEESKKKQIIISTHSPQTLDSLIGYEDLDGIIIAGQDKEKGTLLRHLDEKEIAKARKYMSDEGYLSDYWTHSDLEFKYR